MAQLQGIARGVHHPGSFVSQAPCMVACSDLQKNRLLAPDRGHGLCIEARISGSIFKECSL